MDQSLPDVVELAGFHRQHGVWLGEDDLDQVVGKCHGFSIVQFVIVVTDCH